MIKKILRRYEHWLTQLSKKRSRQGLYEFLDQQFTQIQAGAKVLSVGSGGDINQLLNHHARLQQFRVMSFDIDANRFPDILGDICHYEFELESFDAIIMCEVLEHLHAPHLGLDNCFRSLKPGGKLVLSTPFILPIHDRPYDYFRFTRYGLELLLKKFDDVIILERNSYFEAIDVLWVRLLQTKQQVAKYACFVIVPVVFFLFRPITIILSKLIRVDAMTTGYVVTAKKGEG